MSKKNDIEKIAKAIEDRLVQSSIDPKEDSDLINLVATFSNLLEKYAQSYNVVGHDDLEKLYALASAFDRSGDPDLQKEASAIDQILFAVAKPMEAIANLNKVYDEDLEKLRFEERVKDREEKYSQPKEDLDKMHGTKAIAEAVENGVRRYRSLEAPLSTRYSPDRPGVSLMRITDNVYQDPTTGKIYNYESGYTTDKGNKIPGGSVQYQTQDVGHYNARSMFTTREGLLSSASEKKN